jgi:hypothetical protein
VEIEQHLLALRLGRRDGFFDIGEIGIGRPFGVNPDTDADQIMARLREDFVGPL